MQLIRCSNRINLRRDAVSWDNLLAQFTQSFSVFWRLHSIILMDEGVFTASIPVGSSQESIIWEVEDECSHSAQLATHQRRKAAPRVLSNAGVLACWFCVHISCTFRGAESVERNVRLTRPRTTKKTMVEEYFAAAYIQRTVHGRERNEMNVSPFCRL